jgi:hypothetical protein
MQMVRQGQTCCWRLSGRPDRMGATQARPGNVYWRPSREMLGNAADAVAAAPMCPPHAPRAHRPIPKRGLEPLLICTQKRSAVRPAGQPRAGCVGPAGANRRAGVAAERWDHGPQADAGAGITPPAALLAVMEHMDSS